MKRVILNHGKVENVWVSGKSDTMIKVTLDNGREIITTPNHKYMLRDGSYLEAENLKEGQSLMPFAYNHKVKRVELLKYETPIDVYDIEVKDYHNFFVNDGVMLHNCYRFAYMATQLGYKYGEPQNERNKYHRTNKENYGRVM